MFDLDKRGGLFESKESFEKRQKINEKIKEEKKNRPKKGLMRLLPFNLGGEVKDNDNDTSNNDVDSVPAVLTPGEFVVTKDAVEKVGVDTLEGLNSSVGATNEPTKIPKEKKKYTMTHQDDLLKRIRRVKGYENVTIEDVINDRVGMPNQQYVRLLGYSDAAKATKKKRDEAKEADKKKYGEDYYNYYNQGFNQGGLVEGLKKMFSGGKETTRSLQNLSDVDYYYLGLAISGEARLGSDDEFAVAASILNRVSSKDYKNSIKDVVLSSDTADGTREYEALNILDVNNPKIQPEVKKYLENPNIILSRLKSESGEQKIIEMIEKLDGRTNYKGQNQISNRVKEEDPMFDPKGNFFHYNFQETPQTLRNATEEQKNYRPPTTEDFVKQIEPKPTGLMRVVSGVLDAVTGDKYDFDSRSSDNLQSVIESKSDQLAQNIFTPPSTQNNNINLLPIPINQQQSQPTDGNVSVTAPKNTPQVTTTPVASTMSSVSFINMISNKQLSVG
jgi:hypothetical protein